MLNAVLHVFYDDFVFFFCISMNKWSGRWFNSEEKKSRALRFYGISRLMITNYSNEISENMASFHLKNSIKCERNRQLASNMLNQILCNLSLLRFLRWLTFQESSRLLLPHLEDCQWWKSKLVHIWEDFMRSRNNASRRHNFRNDCCKLCTINLSSFASNLSFGLVDTFQSNFLWISWWKCW